ncbi:unnamed protein product [Caenorhabditis brenneri]
MSTIECGICFLQYNEAALIPRILTSCGHTICQQCALMLLRDGETITCPFDKKDTQLDRNDGVNGLQKNFALLDLCRIMLPKCPKHPHNIAKLLCTDPNCKNPTKIMCQTCVLIDQHRSHKHDSLREKLLENEPILKDLQKKNEKCLLEKERCIRSLDPEEWEVTGCLFTEAAQSISNQFDMMKEKAIQELTQFANERKKEQTALKTRLEYECSVLKKAQNLIEKKLKTKNYLQTRDEVTCLENSHKLRSSSQDKLDGFLNFEFIVPPTELRIESKRKKEERRRLIKSILDEKLGRIV